MYQELSDNVEFGFGLRRVLWREIRRLPSVSESVARRQSMRRGYNVMVVRVAQQAGFLKKNQKFPARPPIVSTLDARNKILLATSATRIRIKP